jgi:hypothetical protein
VIESATTHVVVCISAGSRNPKSPLVSQLTLSTTYGAVPTVTPAASQGKALVIAREARRGAAARTARPAGDEAGRDGRTARSQPPLGGPCALIPATAPLSAADLPGGAEYQYPERAPSPGGRRPPAASNAKWIPMPLAAYRKQSCHRYH